MPTDLYRKYRNPDTSGAALAKAIRKGYAEIFSRNEYAHELSRDKLTNLVVEITGKQKDDRVVAAVVGTFWALREKADFNKSLEADDTDARVEESAKPVSFPDAPKPPTAIIESRGTSMGLNLSYTINLNLPETDDINVFNAIFKSLKENMLKS